MAPSMSIDSCSGISEPKNCSAGQFSNLKFLNGEGSRRLARASKLSRARVFRTSNRRYIITPAVEYPPDETFFFDTYVR